MNKLLTTAIIAVIGLSLSGPLLAQSVATVDEGQEEQEFLRVFFSSGSATVGTDQATTLDLAARTFREGAPFVMIVSGGADTVGNAEKNLELSLLRAKAVADALAARGIPVDRMQVLGRGNSELDVATGPGVSEKMNRSVVISWR